MLLLIMTAFFWSLGGLMIKKVNPHPVAIAGWRSAIAVLFLIAWKPRPNFTWSLPRIGGGCACAANLFSFVCATKLTTAANAILLQYTAPAYMALFGIWFRKERPRSSDWIAIVIFRLGAIRLQFTLKSVLFLCFVYSLLSFQSSIVRSHGQTGRERLCHLSRTLR